MSIPARVRKRFKFYSFYAIAALLIFLTLLLFDVSIKRVIAVLLMLVIGSLSKIYKSYIGFSLGFELITPFVIVIAYTIGFLPAVFAAIFMVIAADFISTRILPYVMAVQIGAYVVIALAASTLSSAAFVPLALILLLFRDVVIFSSMMLWGQDIIKSLTSTVPNVIINGFILIKIGEWMVRLVQ